jgi:hypothetical protein
MTFKSVTQNHPLLPLSNSDSPLFLGISKDDEISSAITCLMVSISDVPAYTTRVNSNELTLSVSTKTHFKN